MTNNNGGFEPPASNKPNDTSGTKTATHKVIPDKAGGSVIPSHTEIFIFGSIFLAGVSIISHTIFSGIYSIQPLILGLLLTLGGWLRLTTISITKINNKSRTITHKKGILTIKKKGKIIKLDDLQKIQVISKVIKKTREIEPIQSYELNLFLTNGSRLTIANYGKKSDCLKNAHLLSEITRRPVVIIDNNFEI